MKYDTFCQQCERIIKNDQEDAQWFYDAATQMFKARRDFNERSSVALLFYHGGQKVYKNLFFRRKRVICAFYDWLYEQGEVSKAVAEYVHGLQLEDVISDYEINRFYFSDLEAVFTHISRVGKGYQLSGDLDMLNIKAIAVLAWYGFGADEMAEILKSDLNEAMSMIVYGGKAVSVEPEHMAILIRFAKEDSHLGFPTGKPQFYKMSPYLMRSARQEHMTANSIWGAIKRFNYVSKDYGVELSIHCLQWCGIFRRIYDSSSGESVNVLIKKETGGDKAFASAYVDRYERWRQVKIDNL